MTFSFIDFFFFIFETNVTIFPKISKLACYYDIFSNN